MLSKVNLLVATLLLVVSVHRSLAQSNSGSSVQNTVTSVNGSTSVSPRPANVKVRPAVVNGSNSTVKTINKKKRKSAHVTAVKKDAHAVKKATQ